MPMQSTMTNTKLPQKWSEFLTSQPETGMGFQDIEITLTDGSKISGIALNAEFVETVASFNVDMISDMRVKSGSEIGRWA